MTANIGSVDKILRLIVGIVLCLLAYLGNIGWWGWLIGVILIATAAVNFCPLYRVLGFNTLKK